MHCEMNAQGPTPSTPPGMPPVPSPDPDQPLPMTDPPPPIPIPNREQPGGPPPINDPPSPRVRVAWTSTKHWYPEKAGQCPEVFAVTGPLASRARTRTLMSRPAQAPLSCKRQVKSTQLPGGSAPVSSTAT
jgi:hypothetical protein